MLNSDSLPNAHSRLWPIALHSDTQRSFFFPFVAKTINAINLTDASRRTRSLKCADMNCMNTGEGECIVDKARRAKKFLKQSVWVYLNSL